MSTAVAKTEATTDNASALIQMVERAAANPEIDVDKLERLLNMQERMLAKQAESDFSAAMTAAQSEIGRIAADASNSQTHSKYATYAALDKVLRPIYTKHGFALSFDTGDPPEKEMVRVTCRVSHRGGHSHTYHIDMPADGKGAKGGDVMTKTHATGSGVSYGRRYLLIMIFNVAVGEDDDGNAAGGRNLIEDILEHNQVVRDNWGTIAAVKDFLLPQWGDTESERNLDAAKEAFKEMTLEEQRVVWRAPTKGGLLTTEERALLKGTHAEQRQPRNPDQH